MAKPAIGDGGGVDRVQNGQEDRFGGRSRWPPGKGVKKDPVTVTESGCGSSPIHETKTQARNGRTFAFPGSSEELEVQTGGIFLQKDVRSRNQSHFNPLHQEPGPAFLLAQTGKHLQW